MSNPISGIVDARPDRPEQPWRYWAIDWHGSLNIAEVSDDETDWSFCITSIHMTGYALRGDNIFRLTHQHDGIEEFVFEAFLNGLATQSFLFPTPLVIESPSKWNLNGTRITPYPQYDLMLTMVGFWAQNDLRPDQQRPDRRRSDQRHSDQVPYRNCDPLQPPTPRTPHSAGTNPAATG